MKPNLQLVPLLVMTAVRFSAILCHPQPQPELQPYNVCALPITCGNLLLGYPFWGLGRPAYCGHSGFHVTSNPFKITYESVDYRVLATDNTTQMITMARDDMWTNTCSPYLHNTSYNSTLFNSDYFQNVCVSLYYGCKPSKSLGNRFSCLANGTNNYGYFYRTSDIDNNYVSEPECESHISILVKAASPAAVSLTDNATQHDLTRLLRVGFELQWAAHNFECYQCLQSGGRCGSNLTFPFLFACYCHNGNFSLICNDTDGNGVIYRGPVHKFNMKQKLVTGLSCSIAGITFLCFVILCWRKRLWETRKAANQKLETFIRDYGPMAPKRYKYSEIKKITNSFQEELGRGGYGSVYKGTLPDDQLVAVKLLAGALGDGEDFINEVASISRTCHVNIVTLLGFCVEGKKRALIYEFMPNGSLDKFSHGDDARLDWNTLLLIAKGIARGLEYLHRGCNTRIVHFDIKPHNILLDEEFVPKISDFGLAKLCKKKESIVSVMGARGTPGYMAPEVYFRNLGGASHKSDVYSYGMMVLEMTGSHKNNNPSPTNTSTSTSEEYFPECIYKKVEAGDDLGVYGVTTIDEDELARKMVTVSLWCIQSGPSDRPSISKVVEMLEGSLESLQLPPRRFWPSPTRPAQDTSPLATQVTEFNQ